MRRQLAGGWIFLLLAGLAAAADRLQLDWPTPNPAWLQGRPPADYLQATASGDPASGGFGCVREEGKQFHEGIDLKPVARDAAGEPADKIFAFMDGVVRYVNERAAASNYRRYVVLEHPAATPAVYTLYAHLRSVAAGLRPGVPVTHGQIIAVMGRSEGGDGIPQERAHLHFEIGLRVTDAFAPWYDAQKFDSPNEHGLWNGLNLMGFDPLEFLGAFRAHQVDDFKDYFAQLRPAVHLRIATAAVPDFTRRYPSLLTRAPAAPVAGWEIACNWTGLPFRWTPLAAADVAGYARNEVRIVESDAAVLAACPCKSIVVQRDGRPGPGRDLTVVLQQLFGL